MTDSTQQTETPATQAPTTVERINSIISQLNTHRDPEMFGEEIDDDFEMDTYVTGGTWFKKDGKWFKNVNGVTTEVNPDALEYLNHNCRNFFLFNTSDEFCNGRLELQKTIIEKIKNNLPIDVEISQLINFLVENMSQNYEAFKNAIQNLHPFFVITMLKSFGFTMDDSYIHQDKIYINSVKHWIANGLPKYVTNPADRSKILNQNNNILNFLGLLVNYINANPGILNTNKGYDIATYEEMARKAAGEEITVNNRDQVYNIRFTNYSEALRYLQASIRNNMRRFNLYPLLYMRPNISGLYVPGMFGMFGGGNRRYAANPTVQVGGTIYQYQVQQLNNPENVNCGTRYANMMYNRLTSKLAAGNKKLHDRDQAHFKNLIQNLKTYEERLYKFLSTFGNYVDNGGQYSTNANVVKSGEMKRFVDGLRLRGNNVWNQEAKIVNALLRIANYVDSLPAGQGPRGRVNEVPIPII